MKTTRALSLGVAAWVAWAGPSAAGDLSAIQARGTLRVAIWDQSMPEFFTPNGIPAPGFERELLQAFASLQRLKLEPVVLGSMDALLGAVEQGDVDLMAGGLVATATRRARVDFAAEVFPTRHVVLTRKPRAQVLSLDQLRRERVGTVTGTSWADAVVAAGVPSSQIKSFAQIEAMKRAFESGEVPVVIMAVGSALLLARSDPEVQVGLFLGSSQAVAWGVKKGNPELLGALNEYVGNVRRTPTWSRLVIKYWGDQALEILKRAQNP